MQKRSLSTPYLAFICLAYLPSCAASDEAPKGARPGHPGELTAQPRPASTVSALDQAILEDYPPRPWSKNVPSQTCSRDEECGDGFCDRGVVPLFGRLQACLVSVAQAMSDA